jgi:hypothetical protein
MRNSGLLWIPTFLAIFGMMFFAAMSNFGEWVYQTPVVRKPR